MGRKRKKKGLFQKQAQKIMQTPVAVKEGYGLALLKTDKLIKGEANDRPYWFSLWFVQRHVFQP